MRHKTMLIGEIHIKVTMKQQYIIPEWWKFEKTAGKDLEHLQLSCIADGNVKWYRLYGNIIGSFLKY